MNEQTKERILVIKLSALGDFMLALGAMEAIRRHHPDAHITLLTTRPFLDIAERSGYFDAIIVDQRPKFYELSHWFFLFQHFNRGQFTRVYDLQFNNRTKIYSKMFLNKPEWSGVIPGSPLFYPNPNWLQMHAFDRHREVLKVAGIDMKPPDISWMKTDISHLNVKPPYVLMIPGSAPTRPEKRWSAMRYGALGLKLQRDGYQIVVVGTKAEGDVIARVVKSCPGAIDLSGQTTLYDLATLARGAAGAIGNDTGPTHLVALAGCPTVALFCTTVSRPEFSAPVGARVLQADNLDDISVKAVYDIFTPRNVT